jgi:UDP-N-acetylmuramate: L-alanyl-gamma-D-glutamyl-meso-diaminopimelate ligase
MHIHVLGICGTFMGGLAQLAAARGDRVTGADSGVYPPMSEQLEAAGIELVEGWDPAQLSPAPDLVVIGNALSRGNPAVEAVLERDLPYTSGPAWLREYVLRERHVVAVAGTHGKTTTASMVAHILAEAGMEPGFLIGGVPAGFGVSARLGAGRTFVVEADEYDSAFFDKRSKFVHYGPRTLVLNNLEFDHADIFEDLAAIQRQFHHLVRTVPGNGRILTHAGDAALEAVLAQGCWTPVERFAPDADEGEADWRVADLTADGSGFDVSGPDTAAGRVEWSLLGRHNVANGLAAIAAARHAGVEVSAACAALSAFGGVRRRLEVRGTPNGITVYDDFAHHPTAIATTLSGLRARVGGARILAALDLASNSMRMGVHRDALADALRAADRVYLLAARPLDWDPGAIAANDPVRIRLFDSAAALAAKVTAEAEAGDHVVLMSNSGFGGLPGTLPEQLAGRAEDTSRRA